LEIANDQFYSIRLMKKVRILKIHSNSVLQ
jgi:hypothetical protein